MIQEKVYDSKSLIRSPLRLFSTMIRDVSNGNHLAYQIFARDVKAKYRQSALGFIWVFLPPIAATFTFAILNENGVISVGDTSLPYIAYAMIGTLLWQSFADSIQAPLRIVTQAKPMLTKINFPRESLLVAGVMQVVFDFLVRLVLFIGVLIYFKIEISTTALLVPVGVFSIILLGTTFGIILTPIGMLYTDVQQALTMMLGFWMLITPVVYPPATGGILKVIADLNPVSPLIVSTREFLTATTVSFHPGFFAVIIASGAFLLIGWIVFRVALPHIISRIGN